MIKKSVGNMYPWVTHTHCHLGGECPHKCVYCYVDHFPFGRPAKYQGPLRITEKELSVKYGSGKTIFIENCNDLFAEAVPYEFISKIISHCCEHPMNTYVFQTKNPKRFECFIRDLPGERILGTTIETNRHYLGWSSAPDPIERARAMNMIQARKFITIEPIMNFDVDILTSWIDLIRPEFVNIGADSKGHNLPEPSADKVSSLIKNLKGCGIEIREKHNLHRLLGGHVHDDLPWRANA